MGSVKGLIPCTRCDEPIFSFDRFCRRCGFQNPHFDQEWHDRVYSQGAEEDCPDSHKTDLSVRACMPESASAQHTIYCSECGMLIVPM